MHWPPTTPGMNGCTTGRLQDPTRESTSSSNRSPSPRPAGMWRASCATWKHTRQSTRMPTYRAKQLRERDDKILLGRRPSRRFRDRIPGKKGKYPHFSEVVSHHVVRQSRIPVEKASNSTYLIMQSIPLF